MPVQAEDRSRHHGLNPSRYPTHRLDTTRPTRRSGVEIRDQKRTTSGLTDTQIRNQLAPESATEATAR